MATELHVRLSGLAAPDGLVDWARRYPDLETCWNACAAPEFLLWLAARLSTTPSRRRAVVGCLAELTRQAERGCRHPDQSVERAAGTAEAWARTGAGLAELAAAERAALQAAERAATAAAEDASRARVLLRSVPRPRGSSFGRSRGLGALAGWQEANQARRLALAAAGTARAALEAAALEEATLEEAARGDASCEDTAHWEAGVSASADYAVSVLERPGAGADSRAARRTARLIRHRLPCPRLANPDLS
jgi:hypothetical protein